MNKLYKILMAMLCVAPITITQAQNVGIGTNTPNASAKLHIVDANRGILIPQVSIGNVALAPPVTAPATGLLVWNTNAAVTGGTGTGFYYWDGTKWVPMNDGPHNTLDMAYDEGGPGLGRVITADAGRVEINGTGGLLVNSTTTTISESVLANNTNGTQSTATQLGWVGTTGGNTYAYGVRSLANITAATSLWDGGIGVYGGVMHPTAGTINLNATVGSANKAVGIMGGIGTTTSITGSAQDMVAAVVGSTGLHNSGGGTVTGSKLYAGLFAGNGRVLGVWGENSGFMEFLPRWQNQDYDAAVVGFYNTDVDGGNNAADIGTPDTYFSIESNVTDATAKDLVLQTRSVGNVGIGIAAPSEKLHVVGNTRISSLAGIGNRLVQSNATGVLSNIADGTVGQVLTTNGAGVLSWGNTAATAWALLGNAGTNAATNFVGTTDAQDLVFRTNNIENARINISGNVDIGAGLDDARIYARILNTDLTTNYGIYNYHDGGITAGTTYALRNHNYSSTDGTKYGIYNYINAEGIGGRYGIQNYSYLDAAATTAVSYGLYNYTSSNGAATTGAQNGIYNYLTSTAATGVHYGQRNYLYLNPASVSAGDCGEWTFVDYSAGARYGEYKELATNATVVGSVYGDYTYVGGTGIDNIFAVVADVDNTGTGTHYGLYSNVPGGTNDYAAYFVAGNVVMNENAGDYDVRIEGTTEVNLLKVDASQNKVGIGMATPTYRLDIYDPAITDPTYVYRGRNGTATGTRTQIGSVEYFQDQSSTIDFTGGSSFSINLNAAAAYDLQLAINSAGKPGSNAWTVVSDGRLKEDVNPFKDGLETLRGIEPVYFKYNGKANVRDEHYFVGVVAQDLEKVAPYMVGSFESAPGDVPFEEQMKNTETYKSVDNGAMTYIAINAIKELDAQQNKVKETFKNISDFGVATLSTAEMFVAFNEDFKNKLTGTPVVAVTSINSTASLTIVNQTNIGFTVRINGDFAATDFNWVAMAKVKEDALNAPKNYTEAERQAMLNKVKAEEAKINYNAELKEIEVRKQAKTAEELEAKQAGGKQVTAKSLPVTPETELEEKTQPEMEKTEANKTNGK